MPSAKLNGVTVPLGDTPLGDADNEEDSSASAGEGTSLEDADERPWRGEEAAATLAVTACLLQL